MTPTQSYLKRLSRAGQGTASEIVAAAWRVAQVERIGPQEVLMCFDSAVQTAIRAAATKCVADLLPDSLGFSVGASFTVAAEAPENFVPREFVAELAK
jgi:hypothetical protein